MDLINNTLYLKCVIFLCIVQSVRYNSAWDNYQTIVLHGFGLHIAISFGLYHMKWN